MVFQTGLAHDQVWWHAGSWETSGMHSSAPFTRPDSGSASATEYVFETARTEQRRLTSGDAYSAEERLASLARHGIGAAMALLAGKLVPKTRTGALEYSVPL